MKKIIDRYRGGIVLKNEYRFESKIAYQETSMNSLIRLYNYLEENCVEDIDDLHQKQFELLIDSYLEVLQDIQERERKLKGESIDTYIMIALCKKFQEQLENYSENIQSELMTLRSMITSEKRKYKFYSNMWSWYNIKLSGIDDFIEMILKNDVQEDKRLEHKYKSNSGEKVKVDITNDILNHWTTKYVNINSKLKEVISYYKEEKDSTLSCEHLKKGKEDSYIYVNVYTTKNKTKIDKRVNSKKYTSSKEDNTSNYNNLVVQTV